MEEISITAQKQLWGFCGVGCAGGEEVQAHAAKTSALSYLRQLALLGGRLETPWLIKTNERKIVSS